MQEKNHVFYPSSITNPKLLAGHGQTIMTEIKDEYVNLAFPSMFGYEYDEEELLKLEDGGEMLVNYKF